MRALVIDDSRTTRLIIGGILQELGIDWLGAKDGHAALESLKGAPEIELLIVDWNMPEMNGIDFIRAVRSQPPHNALRILMVTTETKREQVIEALDAGADEYLMKPFNKEDLVAKLNLLNVLQE